LIDAHKSAVVAIADALVERRTLNGDEIDRIIAGALAVADIAAERERRTQWMRTIESTKSFEADHG
jgi:hypothetical protein